MKKLILFIMAFASLTAFASTKETTTQKVKKVQLTDVQKGKVIYENSCNKCHQLFPTNKFKTAKEWDRWVDRMAPKAKLTKEQTILVKKYVTYKKKPVAKEKGKK